MPFSLVIICFATGFATGFVCGQSEAAIGSGTHTMTTRVTVGIGVAVLALTSVILTQFGY
jgi:hypothetical protein